ncbi:MAG: hypothetical protein JNM65_02665 [Verrucomicrobiaceae bacterium]|nr:hypothetical protein [Verrucomicrobiaceae bacterium]
MEVPQQLPQAGALQVEQIKVVEYLLNHDHAEGGPKAKYFRNRGFKPEAWQAMADALRTHGATQPVTETSDTRFGRKFTVECQIETPDGRNPCILTAWIQEGTKPPRLVTAHPNG